MHVAREIKQTRWRIFFDTPCNILYTLSKVIFRQRSSSVIGCLLSKVVFRQRSSSIKGRLPLKGVLHRRSSSIEGRLPSKGIFHQSLSPKLTRCRSEFRQKRFWQTKWNRQTHKATCWCCSAPQKSVTDRQTNRQTNRQTDGKQT